MIIERMKYELMESYGEPFIKEKEKQMKKEETELQHAFECLALRYAQTISKRARLDSEQDAPYWRTISDAFQLSEMDARLLFKIAYQFPKEFRIAHLSKSSQAAYKEHLNVLMSGDFIYKLHDFYGYYYQLNIDLLRTIVFGENWEEAKMRRMDNLELSMIDGYAEQ